MEPGMSLDGLGDEPQLLVADALAVVGAVFVPLEDVIGAIGDGACRALSLKVLLAEMATDHGVDAPDFLKDLGAFLLERR